MKASETLKDDAARFKEAADRYGDAYGLTGKTPDELFAEAKGSKNFARGAVAATLTVVESMISEAEKLETEGN